MVRILLYTGKGGVGKTSIAAATALLCAARGYRTIVLSTDIAHSLADAFDVPLGAEPSEIAPNLWGQEPDVYFNIGRYWRTIQTYVAELFSWHGLDEVLAEEMSVLPLDGACHGWADRSSRRCSACRCRRTRSSPPPNASLPASTACTSCSPIPS